MNSKYISKICFSHLMLTIRVEKFERKFQAKLFCLNNAKVWSKLFKLQKIIWIYISSVLRKGNYWLTYPTLPRLFAIPSVQQVKLLKLYCFFKKNGPTTATFCLFSFFSTKILQKNCILQRESKSDRRSRRRARWPLDHHHGPKLFC